MTAGLRRGRRARRHLRRDRAASLAAASVVLWGWGLWGCAPGGVDEVGVDVVADDLGRPHDLSTPRSRIVSLVPSATETLVQIGAGNRLIARTQYDVQPELASLPSLGDPLSPSIEALVELAPDLVILWPARGHGASAGERLDAVGVPWYGAVVQSVGDFRRLTGQLGRLVGMERRADSLLAAVEAELRAAADSWVGRELVPVVYVVQQDPPTTVGPGTFVDSILAAAGAANAFRDVRGDWPQVSMEDVVWRNPEYVIVPVLNYGTPAVPYREPDRSAGALAAAPGWRAVPAVAAGRVISVDASLFGRPGPRMGEAAAYLARRLHGGPAAPVG